MIKYFVFLDVGSEYVRKLHYIGKKMKNAAATKIWFGGKTFVLEFFIIAVTGLL